MVLQLPFNSCLYGDRKKSCVLTFFLSRFIESSCLLSCMLFSVADANGMMRTREVAFRSFASEARLDPLYKKNSKELFMCFVNDEHSSMMHVISFSIEIIVLDSHRNSHVGFRSLTQTSRSVRHFRKYSHTLSFFPALPSWQKNSFKSSCDSFTICKQSSLSRSLLRKKNIWLTSPTQLHHSNSTANDYSARRLTSNHENDRCSAAGAKSSFRRTLFQTGQTLVLSYDRYMCTMQYNDDSVYWSHQNKIKRISLVDECLCLWSSFDQAQQFD